MVDPFAIWNAAKAAAGEEEGGITFLSLFLFLMMLMTAGLALDINYAVQARNQLQGAADAAGHAAIYWRYHNDEASAVARGVEIAEANMPTSIYGNVLATADVEFGDWDPVGRSFAAAPGNPTAVRVSTRRTSAKANGLTTFLLKFIGKPVLELNTVSVWDSEEGWCPSGGGLFARERIDVHSNNDYAPGTCLHSEDRVRLHNGGTFDDGTSVTMPRETSLYIPGGDPSVYTGLSAALGSVNYNLDAFFNDLPALASRHLNPSSGVDGAHLTNMVPPPPTPILISGTLTDADITKHAVNYFDCIGGVLTVAAGTLIEEATIVTPCDVAFEPDVALESSTLVVLSTSSDAVTAPDGLRVGATDFCTDGDGAAKVIALGDITIDTDLQANGAVVIAGGDLTYTAGGLGMAGIDFMAGGRIDATSSGDIDPCAYSAPDDFRIPVFKMVL